MAQLLRQFIRPKPNVFLLIKQAYIQRTLFYTILCV
jgi:hypothetical protein